jgi:fibronectin-binding autotransporter adhesin
MGLLRAKAKPQRVICARASAWAESLESRVLLSANAWKAAVSGDWDTASNWSLGHIPTATEDVSIAVAGNYTVTHSFGTDAAHSITLSHPLTLSGGTLTVAGNVQANNTFTLSGGTLANATLTVGATGQFEPTTGTLSHVTLASDVTFANGNAVTVVKGLSLGGHTMTFNSGGSYTGITFNDAAAQSLSGPGKVVFAGTTPGNNFFNIYGGAANPVMLAANVTIAANGGVIQNLSGVTGALVIASPITMAGAGNTLTLSGATTQGTVTVSNGALTLSGSWQNNGTVAVNGAGAILNLTGTFSKVGTINHSAGAVNLQGTYNVNGTLALTAATGSWNLQGGTLVNATLSFAGGASLVPTLSSGTLNHVTLGSDWSFPNGGQVSILKGLALGGHTLTFNGSTNYTGMTFNDAAAQSLSGPGTIVLAGTTPAVDFFNIYGGAANPVTFAANVTINANGGLAQNLSGLPAAFLLKSTITMAGAGNTLTLSGATNQGTINVSNGTATLSGSWLNQGIINVTGAGATLDLAGSFSKVGTINHSAGTVNLQGTATINGTLALTAATGSWNLQGGTLVNTTLSFAGGASLIPTLSSGTLNHVTLGSDWSFPNGGQVSVLKGLLLNGHTITFNAATNYTGITFNDAAAQTLAGPGSLVFAGTSSQYDFLNIYGAAANPVTFGAGVVISAKNGLIQELSSSAAGMINAGTINVIGGVMSLGGITNKGTLAVTGGDVNVSSPGIINNGTIVVSSGHKLNALGLTITNNGAGVLAGTGTIVAATITNSGTISPGLLTAPTTGTLTLTGNLVQTASGVIHEELGGANSGQFDRLVVSGAATLAGLLDVYLINGYHPASGKLFNVLAYSSHTGTLNTDGLSLGGGLTLTATTSGSNVTLKAGLPPVDTTKPTVSTPTLVGSPHAGVTTITFKVTYSDNIAVDDSTLGNDDIRVTGPNGVNQLATFVSVSKTNNGTPRAVTYKITLATGTFKAGTYTVAVQANAVKDTKANAVATGAGGTFVLPA